MTLKKFPECPRPIRSNADRGGSTAFPRGRGGQISADSAPNPLMPDLQPAPYGAGCIISSLRERHLSSRASVRSRPRMVKVSKIAGLTVPPVTAMRSG